MKSARLLTNDPTQPVAFVTVHGPAPHDLRAYPDRLYLGGDKGHALSRTITVSGPAEMDLTDASCDKGLFDVQVGKPEVSEDEKKTWKIELTFKPTTFVGPLEDQLSIHTTHKERPLITIPITGAVRETVLADTSPPSRPSRIGPTCRVQTPWMNISRMCPSTAGARCL
jgi:hypothetical protein